MILKVFFWGGGILRRPAAASVNGTTGAILRVEGVFCRPVALCSRHQCLYPKLIPGLSDIGYEFRFLLSSVFL